MNKLILTISSCLIVISQAFAQKDPVALEILDAMSTKYKNIPAFTADFSYIMENDEESIDEKFEGKITVKSGKYKLNTGGQEIYNDGIYVWTYLKDDNEVTISEYDDTEEEITLSNRVKMTFFVGLDVKGICTAQRTCYLAHVIGHVNRAGYLF